MVSLKQSHPVGTDTEVRQERLLGEGTIGSLRINRVEFKENVRASYGTRPVNLSVN